MDSPKAGICAHAVHPEVRAESRPCSINVIRAHMDSSSRESYRDRRPNGQGPVYLVTVQCYDHEVLWLSVAAKNHGHVVVGAVYRLGSGHGGDTQLLDYLDTTIDEAERCGSHNYSHHR